MGHRNHKSRRTVPHKGVALIWVALTAILFIGFAGLSLDTGLVIYTAEQLQGAADASALAAAQFVKFDIAAARTAAINLAANNKAGGVAVQLDPNTANATAGDIVVGRFNRDTFVFTPDTSAPNAVKVVARRTGTSGAGELPLIFGRAFGRNTTNVERDAIAMSAGGTGSGLIALDNSPGCECTFRAWGNGTVNVLPAPPLTCTDGAGIQVNCSNANSAACLGGSTQLETTNINVNGGLSGSTSHVTGGPCGGDGDEIVHENTGTYMPDPLAGVPEPNPSDYTIRAKPSKKDDEVISPGWYKQGIERTGGNLIMQPGVYVLGDTTTSSTKVFDYRGNGTLCGKGVMLYIYRGGVDVNGGSNITLFPIDLDETPSYFCASGYSYPTGLNANWEGIIFFQSRANTAPATFNGNGDLAPQGTLYFPSAHVNLQGNGTMTFQQLIAGTVNVTGSGILYIAYDGRNPAPGNKVFLVE